MLESKHKEIDGHQVVVVQFAGQRNFDILLDLARLVGPVIGAATKGGGSGTLESVMEANVDLSEVADALFGRMDKGEVKDLVTRMLASTYVDDKQIDFDAFFAGPNIWRLPKVLMFVLEVNFGGFSDLGASITALQGGSSSAPQRETRDG